LVEIDKKSAGPVLLAAEKSGEIFSAPRRRGSEFREYLRAGPTEKPIHFPPEELATGVGVFGSGSGRHFRGRTSFLFKINRNIAGKDIENPTVNPEAFICHRDFVKCGSTQKGEHFLGKL
jgi:hypothetical protein